MEAMIPLTLHPNDIPIRGDRKKPFSKVRMVAWLYSHNGIQQRLRVSFGYIALGTFVTF